MMPSSSGISLFSYRIGNVKVVLNRFQSSPGKFQVGIKKAKALHDKANKFLTTKIILFKDYLDFQILSSQVLLSFYKS